MRYPLVMLRESKWRMDPDGRRLVCPGHQLLAELLGNRLNRTTNPGARTQLRNAIDVRDCLLALWSKKIVNAGCLD